MRFFIVLLLPAVGTAGTLRASERRASLKAAASREFSALTSEEALLAAVRGDVDVDSNATSRVSETVHNATALVQTRHPPKVVALGVDSTPVSLHARQSKVAGRRVLSKTRHHNKHYNSRSEFAASGASFRGMAVPAEGAADPATCLIESPLRCGNCTQGSACPSHGGFCVCQPGTCSDAEGRCHPQRAERLDLAFKLSPASHPKSFICAESFGAETGKSPLLRVLNGWRWDREDALWLAVLSPDNSSVFFSTEEAWPSDPVRRHGPVRVLDIGDGATSGPHMSLLRTAGASEWRIEDAGHRKVWLRHMRTGRYLSAPAKKGLVHQVVQGMPVSQNAKDAVHRAVESFMQLFGGSTMALSSEAAPWDDPEAAATFDLDPPSVMDELLARGLVYTPGYLPTSPASPQVKVEALKGLVFLWALVLVCGTSACCCWCGCSVLQGRDVKKAPRSARERAQPGLVHLAPQAIRPGAQRPTRRP